MTIYLRVDSKTPSHITVTVFVNHGNCGRLTMRNQEFDDLFRQLRNGADNWEDVRTDGDGLSRLARNPST